MIGFSGYLVFGLSRCCFSYCSKSAGLRGSILTLHVQVLASHCRTTRSFELSQYL